MKLLNRFFFGLFLCLFLSFGFAQDAFPALSGTTLSDVDMALPQDFTSTYTVVFLPLQQDHEATFRTWETYIKSVQETKQAVDFFQVFPLGDMNFFLKGIIGGAMKGAFDDVVKARSMLLFEDVEPILSSFYVTDDSIMHILLVKNDQIVWRSTGEWTQGKADELELQLP